MKVCTKFPGNGFVDISVWSKAVNQQTDIAIFFDCYKLLKNMQILFYICMINHFYSTIREGLPWACSGPWSWCNGSYRQTLRLSHLSTSPSEAGHWRRQKRRSWKTDLAAESGGAYVGVSFDTYECIVFLHSLQRRMHIDLSGSTCKERWSLTWHPYCTILLWCSS